MPDHHLLSGLSSHGGRENYPPAALNWVLAVPNLIHTQSGGEDTIPGGEDTIPGSATKRTAGIQPTRSYYKEPTGSLVGPGNQNNKESEAE